MSSHHLYLTEEELKEIISTLNKKSKKFLIIILVLLSACNMLHYSINHLMPILLRENHYLCKDSNNNFTIKCKKEFICDQKNIYNIDYILNGENIKSFVMDYEIYCNKLKINLMGSCLILGSLLSVIIAPYLSRFLGIIRTIFYLQLIQSFCYLLPFTNNYYISLIFITVSMFAYFASFICCNVYLSDYSPPETRGIIMAIYAASHAISSFYILLIYALSLNYNYILMINTIFSFLITFCCYFVPDSPTTSHLRGDLELLKNDLMKIARINSAMDEFEEWEMRVKEKYHYYDLDTQQDDKEGNDVDELVVNNRENVMLIDQNETKANENKKDEKHEKDKDKVMITNGKENKLAMINVFSFFNYPSQVKVMVSFICSSLLSSFMNIITEVDMTSSNHFIRELSIFYLIDLIASSLTILMPDSFLGRKYSYLSTSFFCVIIGFSYFLYNINNDYSFAFVSVFRFFITLFVGIQGIFHAESYSSLCKMHGLMLNRIFGRILNIILVTLFLKERGVALMLIVIIQLIGSFAIIFFKIPETKGKAVAQYPIEFTKK